MMEGAGEYRSRIESKNSKGAGEHSGGSGEHGHLNV